MELIHLFPLSQHCLHDLEYRVQHKKDIDILEWVQQRFTKKMVKALKHLYTRQWEASGVVLSLNRNAWWEGKKKRDALHFQYCPVTGQDVFYSFSAAHRSQKVWHSWIKICKCKMLFCSFLFFGYVSWTWSICSQGYLHYSFSGTDGISNLASLCLKDSMVNL